MEYLATSDRKESKCKVIYQKIRNFIKATQIEPVIFMFGFACGLEDVFLPTLIIDKVCDVQLEYEELICEKLNSGQYVDEQNEVQRWASLYFMIRHFAENLPTLVTVFFLAALGASRGLKFALLVTVFGALLKVIVIIFIVLYWSLSPVYIFISYLPFAICGGYSGFYMNCYAYLGITTDKRSRTTRLAMVNVFAAVGVSSGAITAPHIYSQLGYLGVFISEALVFILLLVYIMFLLNNCKPEPVKESSGEIESTNMVARLKTTFSTTFKKRENRGRAQVIGYICGYALMIFMSGASSFYYLYTIKKFSWDYESFSAYASVSNLGPLIGTLLILPSLSYKFNIGDSVIALIGYISRMWEYMIMATAPYGWVMYVASLCAVCGGMILSSSRSALTKIVPPSEITSVFAVLSVLEIILPMADNPLYTYIYSATLETFPGTVFTVASATSAIGCFLYTWLSTSFPKESKIQKQSLVDEEMQNVDDISVH